MRKKILRLSWIIFLLLTSHASGQEIHKYWIFFNDKEIPEVMLRKRALSHDEAREYISERAFIRRQKTMPQSSLVDEADLPVSPKYLTQLGSYGVVPSNILRWFNAVTAYITADQYARISRAPFVRKVVPVRSVTRRMEPVYPLSADAALRSGKNDTLIDHGAAENQLVAINVISVHNEGVTGQNVIIGMLDTGFRWKTNDALKNAHVLAEYDFIFKDSVTANQTQDNPGQDAHGTETFSIIAANTNGTYVGTAPGASFILAKTEDIRSETKVEEDNWAAAIEWMEGLGVDVVSSSLGYSDFDPQGPSPNDYTWAQGDFNGRTAITSQAAVLAARRGVVVVNAMGNEGNGDGIIGTLTAPADADSIISVGAVWFTAPDSGQLAKFSSTGPTNDGRTKPDVVAPGVSVVVVSADGQIVAGDGTSFATPLTAGVAALVLSAHPELTPIQVRNALRSTASNSSVPNNFVGWGEINALAAVKFYDTSVIMPPRPVTDFALFQNYPNPFNNSTIIKFDVPEETSVMIAVYSVLGEKVRTLIQGNQEIGHHTISWDGKNATGYSLPSGVYFVTLRTPHYTSTKKMILLR